MVPSCPRNIVDGEDVVPICILQVSRGFSYSKFDWLISKMEIPRVPKVPAIVIGGTIGDIPL